MKATQDTHLSTILQKFESELLAAWISAQVSQIGRGRIHEPEVRELSRQFLAALRPAVARNNLTDITTEEWSQARDILRDLSRTRAAQGATPGETATFVFSLREPVLDCLHREYGSESDHTEERRSVSKMVDALGLFTFEVFEKNREDLIQRQQQEMLELSTPVVTLYEKILALPLIGTLDSSRTQVVMENLLQRIVETGAEFAIIDITGVPTVDTLVAQYLLKTVAAARLMGADCIISGIRPQIAQTIIHLGVALNDVATKATMAAAFALALERLGLGVRRIARPGAAPVTHGI